MSFQVRTDGRENNNNTTSNRTRFPQNQGGRGGRREWIPRGTNANLVATTNLTPTQTTTTAVPETTVVESWPAQNRHKPNGIGEGSSLAGRGRPNGSYGDFNKRSMVNGGGNRMSLGSRGQHHGRPVNQKREKEKDPNAVKDSSLPQLVQEIQEKLMKGTVECMICYDMVKRSAPVWSCTSCYSIFHLHCTKKWARAPTSVDLSAGKDQGFNWRCPGCQSVQLLSSKEIRYVCFCRKREEPPSDLYLTPHSCGEPCGKPLEKEVPGAGVSKEDLCPHLCVLQCHPGPCPPCKAFAPPRLCPCGKKVITTRCSDRTSVLTCGERCDKLLDCWRHRCEKICHVGPCETCQVVINASCFCKKKSEVVLCGELSVKGEVDVGDGLFSCSLPCEKLLSCGNHVCTAPCHPGPCGDCNLLPGKIKTCYCGKTGLSIEQERHSCLDPIPSCSEICSKTLPCGSHKCKELCHSGDCAPCQMLVTQKCRCGSTSRTVECYKTMGDERFACDKPCGHKKSCGRHRCSERCCPLSNSKNPLSGDWDPHLCSMSCGKKLRCGQHACESLCHSGHCPPCPETIFSDLTCACGRTSIPPPQPCGTPPPSCQLPCSVAQSCGHSSTHSCHFGDCPPCSVPVAKECIGGHVVLRNIPCGSKDIRCNQLCGKTRQCGMHACARTCHPLPCDSSIVPTSGLRASCGQTCGAPRRDCRHTCSALCHPSSLCPDVRCEFRVTITCSCGTISATVPCDAGGSNNGHNVDSLLELSAVQKLPVPLQPVETNGKRIPLGQRKLTCDDECLKVERKRALADAFGITPNLEALHFGESSAVSEVLTDLFRRDPKWVLAVEERCKFLVLGRGRGGSSALKVHVFCPMLKEKRDAVRLIAERWKLSINAAGWEPKRFIVVHVTPKSKAPARIFGAKGTTTVNMINPSVFDPLVDMDPRLVVALFELPSDADISALVLRFGGECELVWLNDKNALAVFSDPARAATAMRRLDQGSLYYGAIVLQNGGVPGVGVASGTNAWGGAGVMKDGGSGSALKGTWKKAVVQESDWRVSLWGDDEEILGDSSRLEASVRKRNEVPIPASSNRWSILDAEITPGSSTSILQVTDPGEPANSQMVSKVEPGASSSVTVEQQMGKDDQASEIVEDWEKAYE